MVAVTSNVQQALKQHHFMVFPLAPFHMHFLDVGLVGVSFNAERNPPDFVDPSSGARRVWRRKLLSVPLLTSREAWESKVEEHEHHPASIRPVFPPYRSFILLSTMMKYVFSTPLPWNSRIILLLKLQKKSMFLFGLAGHFELCTLFQMPLFLWPLSPFLLAWLLTAWEQQYVSVDGLLPADTSSCVLFLPLKELQFAPVYC